MQYSKYLGVARVCVDEELGMEVVAARMYCVVQQVCKHGILSSAPFAAADDDYVSV